MNSEPHHILSPVTDEVFFSQYWEKTPLHIERGDSGYFSSLLSINDIERLLSTGGLVYPDVQVADANRDVSVSDYCGINQQIESAAVRRLYLEGSTVIVTGSQARFEAVADLCRSVTARLVMRSQANVYLSPASQQGFNPHFDTHDVFILQVSGSKVFRFFNSDIELPYTDDTFRPELCADATVQHQVTLNAGDTLYIPRGVVHDAIACGDAPSLHITLGVFAVVVRDLLQEIVQIAGEQQISLRRSVPAEGVPPADELMALLGNAISDDIIETARSRLIDNVALGNVPVAGAALATGALTLDSTIAVVHTNLINVEAHNGVLKVRLHGQILEFEAPLSTAVLSLLKKPEWRVREIAGLNDEQRLVLCRQLQSSGLLELSN